MGADFLRGLWGRALQKLPGVHLKARLLHDRGRQLREALHTEPLIRAKDIGSPSPFLTLGIEVISIRPYGSWLFHQLRLYSVGVEGECMACSQHFLTVPTCDCSYGTLVYVGKIINTGITLPDKCMAFSSCFKMYQERPCPLCEPRDQAKEALYTNCLFEYRTRRFLYVSAITFEYASNHLEVERN